MAENEMNKDELIETTEEVKPTIEVDDVAVDEVKSEDEGVKDEAPDSDVTSDDKAGDEKEPEGEVKEDVVDEADKKEEVIDGAEDADKSDDETKEEAKDDEDSEKADAKDETEETKDELEDIDKEEDREEHDDYDKVKEELENLKAIQAEEKELRDFEVTSREEDERLNNVANAIADNLKIALDNLGVDVNKTLDEIKKEDPEKALKVRQILEQAQQIQDAEERRVDEARKARLQEIVFKRSARLIDGFKLTPEETDVACDTLIGIFNEVGLKDLDDDLFAKVKLAVGQAKLLVPRVEKVAEEAKEIVEDAKDIVADVLDKDVTAEDMADKIEEEKAEEVKEEAVIEEVKGEPKIDVSAFEEGASAGNPAPADGRSADILADLNKITNTRERVMFFKEHQREIEDALKNRSNKGEGK